MKRLLVATSFFALLLSPAAFAQSNGGATTPNPSSGSGSMMHQGGMMNQGQGGTMHQGQGSMSSEHSSAMSRGGSAENVSSQEVKQAQTQLKQQGLYKGKVDGIVGPETKTAISEYQKKEGLPQTASLDQQTLQHLMSTSGSGSSTNNESSGSMSKGSSAGSGSMEHNQGSGSSESGGGMGSQSGQGTQNK